jgi:PAS domain-containing protein
MQADSEGVATLPPRNTTHMTTKIAMFDTPEPTSLLKTLQEYWGYVVFFAGVLLSIVAAVRKLRAPFVYLGRWFWAAVRLPLTLQKVEDAIRLPGNKTVNQAYADLSSVIANEVNWRRNLLDADDRMIFEADKDGKFLWANETALVSLDLEIGEVTDDNWRNFVIGPDRPAVVTGWREAVRDCSHYRTNCRITTREGERWAVMNATCNKDTLGNVLGYMVRFRTIDNPSIHAAAV